MPALIPGFNTGPLRFVDVEDDDLATDGRSWEERPETILAGEHAVDFRGFYNFGADNGTRLPVPASGEDAAALGLSVASLAGALLIPPFGAGAALFTAAIEVLAVSLGHFQKLGAADPYDPNYHTIYDLPVITLPTLPAGFPADVQSDMQMAMRAYADSAALAKASYVTQNRMLSAVLDGDLASFELQNAQLNKYVVALGAAETAASQALTAVGNDFVRLGINLTVTPAQIVDLQSKLSAGGFSALPQVGKTCSINCCKTIQQKRTQSFKN